MITVVSEVLRNLWLLREEVIIRVVRNFCVDTFGPTLCTAQDPLCMVAHGQIVDTRPTGAYPATPYLAPQFDPSTEHHPLELRKPETRVMYWF